jgi:succinate dehydrogenase flavin-adding protein (antitoxin of CptAB toxin-antitoxin module)
MELKVIVIKIVAQNKKMEVIMTTLEIIERKIQQLSEKELSEFRQWFAEFDADIWDAQIESDAAVGKLDQLAQEALEEYEAGKAKEI